MTKTYANTHRLALPWDAEMSVLLAKATELLGQDTFDQALVDLLNYCISFDSCGVMEYYRDRPPRQRLHRFNVAQRTVAHDAYVGGPYVLDPLYGLFLAGADSGVYPLLDLAPDDFQLSEYYQLFYSRTGVADDINLLVRRADGNATVVFLERSVGNLMFSQADLLTLQLVWPVVTALIEQHESRHLVRPPSEEEIDTHAKVQATLANFGRSRLTEREREVLVYMITGYSSAMTGEKLFVTEGTVKNHRKAIHRKLDVGSQAELFSLFIQCIPYSEPGTDGDPLDVYECRPKVSATRGKTDVGD